MKDAEFQDSAGSPDFWLTVITAVLVCTGVVMVFSASFVTASESPQCGNNPYFFLCRQIIWVAIGLLAMICACFIDPDTLRKFSIPGVFLSAILLFLVLIPGIGVEALGARRRIDIGPFGFQPAEFAKIFLVMYLADFLDRRGPRVVEFRSLTRVFVVMSVMLLLIEKEPDLGTTLVIGATFIAMLFISGARMLHLGGIVGIGVAMVAFRIMGEDYRLQRFFAFLNPWKDPLNSGYHIIQSLIALGSGGMHGVGFGESRSKFFYLPEQFTDFIYAVMGEELGLFATLGVLLLFLLLFWRGMRIAWRTTNNYFKLLASGITVMIIFQALVNIGVNLGAFPCTGIPLPFISFGGSSLISCMIGMGLLVNISRFCWQRRRGVMMGESSMEEEVHAVI